MIEALIIIELLAIGYAIYSNNQWIYLHYLNYFPERKKHVKIKVG